MAGCTSVDLASEQQIVRVYKDAGDIACRPESGLPLTELEKPLLEAGLRVISSTCGGENHVQPAMCGIGVGILGVFELSASDAVAAEKFGYQLLLPSPDFKTGVTCKY